MSISDHELDRRLESLPRSCQPPDAVWQRLQEVLPDRMQALPADQSGRTPSRLGTRRMALAAAVAGLALIGTLLLLPMRPLQDSALVAVPPQQTVREAAAPAVGLQRSCQTVEAATAENEAAMRALEAALKHEPGNQLLLEFLAEARLRQADLNSTATRLAARHNHDL
ncbi:hypothetical protein [Wenzhouxiangella limi]|uniref:Uncharacterized protein n=1 Tax=Wenzhouxiangella limi TaxID=2707351 RepID=A0A845V559_9GAMM|nr:hypothetical protein [Wenzhouxiangella limi]NDY95095.1 hypothetical protein [Wenzhouxiangella limi]